MSTERGSFAKFMYKDYNVVAVKSLTEIATKLSLLDILVKVKDEGRHPVLDSAGSMLKLGISGAPYEETEKELREGLEKFQKGEPEDTDLFRWSGGLSNVGQTFSSTSCLTGSLLSGVVDADFNLFTRGKGINVQLQSFATASVDKGHLEDIIRGGKWKPHTENNRLKKWPQRCLWFPGTQPRGRKMWLVHQLLYASKVVVSSHFSSSHGVRLATSAVIPVVIPGLTPGAGLTVSRTANETFTVDAEPGKKVLIGFRAISFRFDAAGNVCNFRRDAGDHNPLVRGEQDDGSVRSHLRGLFLEKPPNFDSGDEDEDEDEDEIDNEDDDEDDEDWDVQPLDIHVDTHESSV